MSHMHACMHALEAYFSQICPSPFLVASHHMKLREIMLVYLICQVSGEEEKKVAEARFRDIAEVSSL